MADFKLNFNSDMKTFKDFSNFETRFILSYSFNLKLLYISLTVMKAFSLYKSHSNQLPGISKC